MHHIVQGVIERAHIGVEFFAHFAGQKPDAFARFEGGARKNDALHLTRQQKPHRMGDGEIGLAGAGGTDAKRQIVF